MALQLKACTSCCSNLNPAKRPKVGRQQEQPSQADLATSTVVDNDGGSWSSDEDDEGCTAVAELEAQVQHLHEQVVILGPQVLLVCFESAAGIYMALQLPSFCNVALSCPACSYLSL